MTKIVSIQKYEHHIIGKIIGASFTDDAVNLWVFNGTSAITPFYTMAAKKLYLKKGFGHITSDSSGGTLWLPPGIKKQIPLYNSIDIAWNMIRNGGFKSLQNGMAIDACLDNKKPTQPHFYLFAIGVLPEMQNKGLGRKLMEKGLAIVDAENMPAYLESSKESNLPFYQSFGFKVSEKVKPTPTSPPMWLMWREAQT